MATLRKHAGAGAVAVLYLALAIAEGGAEPKVFAGVTVAIWWVVIIGMFVRVWPGARVPRAAIAGGAALAGLVALAGLSLIWANDAGRAFEDVVRLAGYLGLFVLALLASRPGSAGGWAGGLATGLALLSAVALLSRFEPGLLADGVGDLAETIPSSAGRLSYPIGYWNGLAACMAFAAVLLVWVGAHGRGRYARALATAAIPLSVLVIYLSSSLGGAFAAVVGLVALLLIARERLRIFAPMVLGLAGGGLLVLLASGREALVDGGPGAALRDQGDVMLLLTLGVFVALAVAAYLLDERLQGLRDPRPAVPKAALVAGGVLVVALGIVLFNPVERWEDFKDPGTLDEAPAAVAANGEGAPESASAAGNGRYQWWAEALDGWASEPLTGLGAGNYELYWSDHATLPVMVQDAHSLYLETFAELGVPGFLLLVAFFAVAVVAGFGRRRSSRGAVAVWLALLAAGLTSAAGEWTWEIPAATVPIILAAAVLTGPATLRPPWPRAVEGGNGAAPSSVSSFGLGVATMLVGFGCIWIAGVALLSAVQLDESRADVGAGELDSAARNARYAAAIQPWSAAPWLQFAQVEELRGRLDEARDAARKAIDRADGDWRVWVVLARIEARDGDREAANRALERANELSPQPLAVELPEPAGESGGE